MATTWNPSDKGANVTLSNGNLTAVCAAASANGVRATVSKSTGKWYWEVTVGTGSGTTVFDVGVADGSFNVSGSTQLGFDAHGVSYRGDGNIYFNFGTLGSPLTTAATYTLGDVIGIAYDAGGGTVAFYKNNVLQYTATGANVPTAPLFPAFSGAAGGATYGAVVNFGATATTYTPPATFSTIDSRDITMSGGVLVGGSATFLPNPAITTNGGVLVGGAATFAGQAAILITTNGGVLVGGSAVFEAPTTVLAETLPAYTMSATGIIGYVITGDNTLAVYTSAGDILVGSVIAGSNTLPALTLTADFGWFGSNTLGAYDLTGAILMGSVSSGDLTLPAYALDATCLATNVLAGANTLPAFLLSADPLIAGGTGQAALLLPAHTLTAAGFSGAVLDGENTLPLYVLVAGAYGTYTLSADNTLPAYQLDATATAAVVAAFRAWVLNLRKRAMTEYTNFAFNSFASCGGRLFAAGPAGIFELTAQTDDAGTPINALVRTGKHTLGASYAKRVPRAYVAGVAAGDLEFRTLTGADGRRAYLLPWNQTLEVQQRRVPIGRGPKSVYWQFELANRAGADFQLDALIVRPELNVRRVAPS